MGWGEGKEWLVLSLGGCSHWGRDNGAQHLLLAGRRDPPVKSQGERGSVGGIDEKGWSQGDAARRKEGRGRKSAGRGRGSRLPFSSVTWSGATASLALSGPAETSRFSPSCSPSPRARHPAGAQYLLRKIRNVANFALGTFPPCCLHSSGEAEDRAGLAWEHAQVPHE